MVNKIKFNVWIKIMFINVKPQSFKVQARLASSVFKFNSTKVNILKNLFVFTSQTVLKSKEIQTIS